MAVAMPSKSLVSLALVQQRAGLLAALMKVPVDGDELPCQLPVFGTRSSRPGASPAVVNGP